MKKRFFYILISLVCLSCMDTDKYEDIANHPNYYDSLYDVSFLRELKQFVRTDSAKIHFFNSDPVLSRNKFLLDGMRTINLFTELEKSYKSNKPILLYFTSFACVNCRKMEKFVLLDEEVSSIIENEFLFIPLTVDDKTRLPENYWIQNPYINAQTEGSGSLKTVGQVNSYFQGRISLTGSQPTLIVLDVNINLGITQYSKDKDTFIKFLKQSILKFNS